MATCTDTTVGTEMDLELRESREKLEIALRAAGMGLWSWEPEHDEMTWEPGSMSLFGNGAVTPPASLKHALTLIHPEDRDRVRAAAARILATGVFEDLEYRVHAGEGTRWILLRGRAIRNGEGRVVRLTGGAMDVTMQRRAADALRRLLEQEQADRRRAAFLAEAGELLAGSLDYRTTLEAVVRLAVPRVADLAGVQLFEEQGEVGSDSAFLVAGTDPEQERLLRDKCRRYPIRRTDPLAQALRAGGPKLYRFMEEPRALLLAGAGDAEHATLLDRIWPQSMIAVPLEARGQFLGILGLGANSRELNPEDLQLAGELGRLSALAIDNARLYQQAQEAARVRDEFLTIAAHELRTPLTPVLLNLQWLLRAERAPSPPAAVIFARIKRVHHQVNRIHRLVEALLDVSRLTGGQLRLELEDLDLSALLAEVVKRHAEQLRRAGCDVTLDLPGGVHGQWDRLRLEQVADNLLANAMKYGSGKPIEIRLEAGAATARLSVREHGIGIAPLHQERIFQRFERAVSSRSYGGLGLGLWITRQMVEAMGGTIRVSSRLGEGSTFTVELPQRAQ